MQKFAQGTDSGVDTYFGLCTYPGHELQHCIDLKVDPRDIYAFGLIAWTGNDVLNRRLRLLAESKGFKLDDTGLFPATHGSGSKRLVPHIIQIKRLGRFQQPFCLCVTNLACEHNITMDQHQVLAFCKFIVIRYSKVRS
ncbi:DNA polymerase lambda-like isoform X2 [Castanea sativa]|uniref:DNA polymerase lambda-like isoform X2 n=1 Tax=Castanea sativa TaxID=21020 RepID=UPI003F651DEE